MFIITQATRDDREQIRNLFMEYLTWANDLSTKLINFSFDVTDLVDKNMNELDVFMPPTGRLMLARVNDAAVGCACMHLLHHDTAELKRMYVQPGYRRQGMGSSLVNSIINASRAAGCVRLRLDSPRFMTDAHGLYRSKGFSEIEAYPESEIPEHFRHHWIFMEVSL
jgi:GNAT superfamily N-acetyltransferase